VSRGARFARGVVWGGGSQFISVVVSFLLLPRIIHGFGVENYGLYLLMLTCSNWVMLFHMGAGIGVVRFVAEASAAEDVGAARAAAFYGARLQLGWSAAAAVAVLAGAPTLAARVFSLPAALLDHGVWMIRAAALGGFFSAVGAWATAVLQGRQHFRRMGALSLAQAVLPMLGVWAALQLGHGLFAATAWFVGIQLALAGAMALGVWRLLRGGGRARSGPSWKEFRNYSVPFWYIPLAQFLSGQGDRVFVAGLRSLSEFTLYAVPMGLLQRLQMLPSSVSSALLPVLGELPQEHGDELRRLYLRLTRVLFALLAPAYALFFALMPQFLSLWLGGHFGDTSVWPARLMTVGQSFGVVAFVPTVVTAGRRDGRWPAAAAWTQAAVCCVLWWALIPRWGLIGAAGGTVAAQAVATAIIVWYVHRRILHLSAGRFVVEVLGPAAIGSACLFAAVWPLRTRVTGWPSFVALCALGSAVYTVMAWRLLPVEDREYLKRHAPALN